MLIKYWLCVQYLKVKPLSSRVLGGRAFRCVAARAALICWQVQTVRHGWQTPPAGLCGAAAGVTGLAVWAARAPGWWMDATPAPISGSNKKHPHSESGYW